MKNPEPELNLDNAVPVRIYCNNLPGDCFTAVFDCVIDGEYHYIGFNGLPFHPQGIGQHGSSKTLIDRPTHEHLGELIAFTDLTPQGMHFVCQEYVSIAEIAEKEGKLVCLELLSDYERAIIASIRSHLTALRNK
ncbi:MAG: hypothetical protein AAGJ08_00135 [Cyanobacteria bacterium P01_H01_bin.35]